MAPPTIIDDILARLDGMQAERTTWDNHWQDIREFLLPLVKDFTGSVRLPGEKRRQSIFDNSGESASDLLAGALHGFISAPGMRWFTIRPADVRLRDRDDAGRWAEEVTRRMALVFNSPETQFNKTSKRAYKRIADFGQACIYTRERPGRLPIYELWPLAECHVEEGPDLQIDTVFRVFERTARWAVATWGDAAGPKTVEKASDPKRASETVRFVWAIYPNRGRDMSRIDVGNAPWASIVVNRDEKVLVSEGGFREFPIAWPRWDQAEDEVYARGCGTKALADVKMLQAMMKVTIRGAEKVVDPPLVIADDGILNKPRLGAAQVNVARQELFGNRLAPMFPLQTGGRPDIGEDLMEGVRQRIRAAYYNNLLSLARDPKMTATLTLKLDEESLRILGPFIGNVQDEQCSPVIKRTFAIMGRAGALPPPPPSLAGAKLEIEYVSPIAKAARLADVSAYAQWQDLILQRAQVDPTAYDIVDGEGGDRMAADRLGVPFAAVRSPEAMQQIREQRAEAQRLAEMRETAVQGAAAMQSVAQATQTLSNDNNQQAA
jgi:hypothetical protein